MEKLSKRKEAILAVLDEEIGELEEKLRKVQPLIDELNQLRKTRSTLLSERTTTGSVGSAKLTMESVIHAMRSSDNGSMSTVELAEKLGVSDTVVRSHLNRHADVRYRKDDEGNWALIGEGDEEE
jgi:response regulator of citrate/malate metabolism